MLYEDRLLRPSPFRKDGSFRPSPEPLTAIQMYEERTHAKDNGYDVRDVNALEKLESLPSQGSGFLEFSFQDISPYIYPLDGQVYALPGEDSRPVIGPSGMCPICNNARSGELNAFYLKNWNNRELWNRLSFSQALVEKHLVEHIGVIYGMVALQGNLDNAPRKAFAAPVLKEVRQVLRAAGAQAKRDRWEYSRDDPELPAPVAVDTEPREIQPSPSLAFRPEGTKAKGWYAYDLDRYKAPLRPWGDKRVDNEIAARSGDAIVFYDEMLDVLNKVKRVYSEIMDGEPPEGREKNYSAAIAAAREQKGVAMDLAKLAIIATKIGDEKDKVRQISPVMRSMLDELGIFDPADAKDAPFEEAEAQVMEGEPEC